MKSIKFIFATLVVSILLTACSATSVSEDEELYLQEEVQAISDDGTAEIDRSRE